MEVKAATLPTGGGRIGEAQTGLTEDRYVAAVEMKEVNELEGQDRSARRSAATSSFIISSGPLSAATDQRADASAGLAGSRGRAQRRHLRSRRRQAAEGRLEAACSRPRTCTRTARPTKAHVEFGFKFHPKGYQPKQAGSRTGHHGTLDLDIKGMQANQRIEAYSTLTENMKMIVFEPHMHAAGVRMCLDAISGATVETLSCAGYNHGWVRIYIRRRCGAAAAEGHDPARHRLFRQHAGQQERRRSEELVGPGPSFDRQHDDQHRPDDRPDR